MSKFTITATAPNGETRTRTTDILYTHATVLGRQVVGFHIDKGTAERAAKRRGRGTIVVETVLDAKAQAVKAAEDAARANAVLANQDLVIGESVVVRIPAVIVPGQGKIADARWVPGVITGAAKGPANWDPTIVSVQAADGELIEAKLFWVHKTDDPHAVAAMARGGRDQFN